MILNPEKALERSAMQAQYGSPVTPKKRGFKEIILTTTAGYIASIAVIACFFLIAAIGASARQHSMKKGTLRGPFYLSQPVISTGAAARPRNGEISCA